jgi:glycosyltransferase involved in cell wall biosynthesis
VRGVRSILYLAPPDGGVGDHATSAIRELERRGFEVRHLTIARGPRAAWSGIALAVRHRRALRRVGIVHVELGRLDDGIFWFALVASCFRRDIFALAHDAPTVSHAPAAALVPWRGAWADRLGYRILGPLLDGRLRRVFARRLGEGGVLSERAAKAWREAGAQHVVVVRQGADAPSRPATSPSVGTHVLFAGFIGPVKGLDMLLDVWPEAAAASDLELIIAGGNAGPGASRYVDELRERTREQERVRWMGSVEETTLAVLFATAAIVCLPYRSSNPASAILVRAMVEGRAIVATDVPASLDALRPADALIVPAGDAAAFAHALRCLLDDPDLRDRLGAAAGRTACERFSWSATVADLTAAYARLNAEFRLE